MVTSKVEHIPRPANSTPLRVRTSMALSGFRRLSVSYFSIARRFTVLAIESSADDTCAAIVDSTRRIHSNVVIKQNEVYGFVYTPVSFSPCLPSDTRLMGAYIHIAQLLLIKAIWYGTVNYQALSYTHPCSIAICDTSGTRRCNSRLGS